MRFSFFSPYFGQVLPSLTPLILRSWGGNRVVTFIVHTNLAGEFAAIGAGTYDNIRIIETSREQFIDDLQARLALNLRKYLRWDPWYLCRLKPAFGEAFTELLQEYDFWGYLDIDVLLADLNRFLIKERFRDIDIDFYHKFGSATMVTLRNTPLVNTAWRKVPHYKRWLNRDEQYPGFEDDGGGFPTFVRRSSDLTIQQYEAAIDSLKIDFRWRQWLKLSWDESFRDVVYDGENMITTADQRPRAALILDFLQKWSRYHTFVPPPLPVTFHGHPFEMFEQLVSYFRSPETISMFLTPAVRFDK